MFVHADSGTVSVGDFLADERVKHVLFETHFRDAALTPVCYRATGFDRGHRSTVSTAILQLHYRHNMQTCRHTVLGVRLYYGGGGTVVHKAWTCAL